MMFSHLDYRYGIGSRYSDREQGAATVREYVRVAELKTAFVARYKGRAEHPARGVIVEYDGVLASIRP